MARNAPRGHLKPVDDLLEPALEATLAALPTGGVDAATAQLARLLARTIDEMDADQRARLLPQHIGQLLRVLELLRPSAGQRPPSRLDGLRAARAAVDERAGWTT